MKLHTETHRDACWTEHVTAAHVSAVQVWEGRRGEKEAREDLREEEETRREEMRQEGRRGRVGELNRKEAVISETQEQTGVSSC